MRHVASVFYANMAQRFFRFRSTQYLLGEFEELERQEIYFTPPDDLNDALEGFKNVVWHGDRTLWHNLLRHYLLCLVETSIAATLLGPEFDPAKYRYIGSMTEADLPDAPIRQISRDAMATFTGESAIQSLLDQLENRDPTLSRDELTGLLKKIHPLALQTVLRVFGAKGLTLVSGSIDLEPITGTIEQSLSERFKLYDDAPDVEREVMTVLDSQSRQIELLYDTRDDKLAERRGWIFLSRDYPDFYVDALDRILFPEWFTACFVKDPSHASMWGVYGDGHRGACLEFQARNNADRRPALNLNGVIGYGGGLGDFGPLVGEQAYSFEAVRYAADYPETEFFRHLGRLPRSKLKDFWYADGQGGTSDRVDDVLQGNEAWRQAYWSRHSQVVATKLPQWAHEEEYRLVLSDDLDRNTDLSHRKLSYRFTDLTGIIFGMKMTHADKIAIIRIISGKVAKERYGNLTFSQAGFSHRTGRIEIRPLSLLSSEIAKLAQAGGQIERAALDELS